MNKKITRIILQSSLVVGALGGTFGLVYGLASVRAHDEYINLDSTTNKQVSYEEIEPGVPFPKVTKWNVESEERWSSPLTENRDKYSMQIIDGTNHEVLDKSFNQSAYCGEVNWDINQNWTPASGDEGFPSENILNEKYHQPYGWAKPSNDQPDGFVQAYAQAIDNGNGAKSLVLPGYMHSTPLGQFKTQRQDQFNKSGYILIDSSIAESNHIASVMFRADQSAFLAGLAACDYLSLNQNNFEHYIEKGPLAVGTYGGTEIPTVTIFMGGFERAVQYFNKYIIPVCQQTNQWTNEETDQHKINFINLGEEDSFFSGTFTIGDGRSITQDLLSRGADVIMPVAGPQTIDTVQEIKNQGSDCIVVGVDTNQEISDMNETSSYDDGSGTEFANKIIKFSAEKNISYLTSSILWLAEKGEDHYPKDATGDDIQIGSYGYLTVGNINNNGCRVSNPGQDYVAHLLRLFLDKPYENYEQAMSEFKNHKIDDKSPFDFVDERMYFNL